MLLNFDFESIVFTLDIAFRCTGVFDIYSSRTGDELLNGIAIEVHVKEEFAFPNQQSQVRIV